MIPINGTETARTLNYRIQFDNDICPLCSISIFGIIGHVWLIMIIIIVLQALLHQSGAYACTNLSLSWISNLMMLNVMYVCRLYGANY